MKSELITSANLLKLYRKICAKEKIIFLKKPKGQFFIEAMKKQKPRQPLRGCHAFCIATAPTWQKPRRRTKGKPTAPSWFLHFPFEPSSQFPHSSRGRKLWSPCRLGILTTCYNKCPSRFGIKHCQ
ncbi:MAG: hypothetical protein A3H42_06490 [Deltaproteobacteria bacterium RIFCSPLOWO2_02_FULL_46_8]|nr:MAG: hypothetical protein A3H42_06490 [Deltaproteobacteria bacterium RIFCSPLOWO2_02_FULL_46_8]